MLAILTSKLSLHWSFNGIPVLHDSIGGRGWDVISGGKRVGELHCLDWKFEARTEVQQMLFFYSVNISLRSSRLLWRYLGS